MSRASGCEHLHACYYHIASKSLWRICMFGRKASGRRREATIRDPIRARIKPIAEPSGDDLVKDDRKKPDLAATGAPSAGRTTIEQVRGKGVIGFLQLLGPGLI